LGTTFGIDVDKKNIDEFLVRRLKKNMRYCYIMHLSLVGKVLVINSILVSSLLVF
jgi:hypothetical protein